MEESNVSSATNNSVRHDQDLPTTTATKKINSDSDSTSSQPQEATSQQRRTQLLLPTPVLIMGMPKTGTSTIHRFFSRSGYNSSHYKCGKYYCGRCIQVAVVQNTNNNSKPLQSCGNYEVYAQMDVEEVGFCVLPQIEYLDELYNEAPKATWLLPTRNITKWARSSQNWIGGSGKSLAYRLSKCKSNRSQQRNKKRKNKSNSNHTPIPQSQLFIGPKTPYTKDLIGWHEQHLERIRHYVMTHPSLSFLEIDIENPSTAQIMVDHFGSLSKPSHTSYWGHENDSRNSKASVMT